MAQEERARNGKADTHEASIKIKRLAARCSRGFLALQDVRVSAQVRATDRQKTCSDACRAPTTGTRHATAGGALHLEEPTAPHLNHIDAAIFVIHHLGLQAADARAPPNSVEARERIARHLAVVGVN